MTRCASPKEIGHGENADGRAGPGIPALAVVVFEAYERKIATDLEVAPFDLANRARQRAYGARRLALALRPRGHDRLEFGDRRPDRV
jgi:hypothetical protein